MTNKVEFIETRNLLTQEMEKVPVHTLSKAEKRFHGITKSRKHVSEKRKADNLHLRWV